MESLVDSHCHLTSKELKPQIGAVMQRAAAAGVWECVTVAQDLADGREALALAAEHAAVRVVAGVHPHEAGKVAAGWDEELTALAGRGDVFAVGETGLDYHYDFSDRDAQVCAFRRQIEIAATVGKPVVIHCREAHRDVLAILAESPAVPGVVFHCFSGTRAEAEEVGDRGYWISLSGAVTFKKSEETRAVAARWPVDRLLIETDAPYLAPEPMRKTWPNEPALVVHTAACIARVRDMDYAELAATTSAGARRFFALPGV